MSHPIFFTSDEHYGHRNIINFCKRPFKDVDEMQEALIANHNRVVPKRGLVYHLGDMFWRTVSPAAAATILNRLNGQHYFVWGNHDEVIEDNADLRAKFVWCKDIAHIHPPQFPKIVLCHYAMRVWRGSHRGDWHLYGHTHGVLKENASLSFDVGVDANEYKPVLLEQVAVRMYKKQGDKSWRGVQTLRSIFPPALFQPFEA